MKRAILTKYSFEYRDDDGQWCCSSIYPQSPSDIVELAKSHGLESVVVLNDDLKIEKTIKLDNIYIVGSDTLNDWQLSDITDPITLNETIELIENRLNIKFAWKPNTTGKNIIQDTNRDRWAGLLKRPKEYDERFFREYAARDLEWIIPITECYRNFSYLHSIDKNQMYLSALNIALPCGEYRHEFNPAFDSYTTGFWKTDINHGIYGRLKWLTTAEVNYFYKYYNGTDSPITEAYIFDKSARILEPFYKKLLFAIKETSRFIDVPHIKAQRAIKSVYRSTVGLFAKTEHRSDWWNRPDWKWAIIAEAKIRMLANINRFMDNEFHPVAALTDEIYFISDNPNADDLLTVCANYKIKHEALPLSEFLQFFDTGNVRKLQSASLKWSREHGKIN